MTKSVGNSGSGAAAATARALSPHEQMEQRLSVCATPELACAELSRIFRLQPAEIALMRVEKDVLNFLFPVELKAAGFIPLSSSKAVAARTAITRKVELFNNFVIVQHANVFETIRLTTLGQSDEPGANASPSMICRTWSWQRKQLENCHSCALLLASPTYVLFPTRFFLGA